MIMKYDKMIEITQAESRRKMEVAKKAISGMLDNMERITVAELVKRTGLSRGFFHRQEAIFKNQHPVIMDKELENTMVDLKLELLRATMQNEELVKSNEQLRQQVEKLQKQLGRKEISLLKRL